MSFRNDINNFTFTGTLIGDTTAETTKNGKSRMKGAAAVHRSYRDQNGENKEVSFFISFSASGSPKYAEMLKKGAVVSGVGRIDGVFKSKSEKLYIQVSCREIKMVYGANEKRSDAPEASAPAVAEGDEAPEENPLPF